MEDEFDHCLGKFAKNYTDFLVKKVRSGAIIPDLDPTGSKNPRSGSTKLVLLSFL
jgi:hypothetical protein